MSKVSRDTLYESVGEILKGSKEKQRKFLETVELQITLKNYDPQKDKRFSGTVKWVSSYILTATITGFSTGREKRRFPDFWTTSLKIMLVSFRLPNIPRPKQQICVIGDAAHNDEAESKGVPHMSADDLKKLNKDKVRYFSQKALFQYKLQLADEIWQKWKHLPNLATCPTLFWLGTNRLFLEIGQEACQEVRCFPCFWILDQTNPTSFGSRFEQGW